MADLNEKGVVPDNKEQQSGLLDISKIKLAAAVLAVGLSTSVQASDLLKQCDFNKNGAIDTPQMYRLKTRPEYAAADPKIKDIITREKKCETDFSIAQNKTEIAQNKTEIAQNKTEIAQKDASIAKGKEELAKLKEEDKNFNQILAMLDKDELKKSLLLEVTKTENELKKEKDKIKREKLLIRLDILKGKLKELDKNVA